MAKPENSLLFSLKELRSIEEDRVKQEQDAERNRIESEKKAELDAKQRIKDEEERKIREAEEARQRMEHEKDRQIREEKLRLEESERKARIEAQAKLDAARIQAEIHAKAAAKKAPIGLILGGVGGVIALAGGALLYVFLVVMPAREAEQARKAQDAQDRAVAAAEQKVKDELTAQYDAQIANTKDEAQKARLIAERNAKIAQQTAAMEAQRHRSTRPAGAPPGPAKPKLKKLDCDPDKDPLCGSGI